MNDDDHDDDGAGVLFHCKAQILKFQKYVRKLTIKTPLENVFIKTNVLFNTDIPNPVFVFELTIEECM